MYYRFKPRFKLSALVENFLWFIYAYTITSKLLEIFYEFAAQIVLNDTHSIINYKSNIKFALINGQKF